MTTVEICLVNLSNTGQFKYYDIQDIEDLKSAYDNMREIFLADEIEIQGMSHCNTTVENLADLLETSEDNQAPLKDVIQVFEAVGCIHRTKEVIKEHLYSYIEGRSKEGAFIQYLEDTCYFDGIPDRIINYIDYKAIMRDYEIEGLTIEQIGYTDTYLFIG